MTLKSLQVHEEWALGYLPYDYRRKSLEKLVQKYVTGNKVLDVRCLTGHLAVDLMLRGFDVTGLDGHVNGVAMSNDYARSKGIQREFARIWDLTHLREAVDGKRFDTVICLDTLNHAEDDTGIIRQIGEVLVPGGRLIVAAPAFPSLHRQRDRSLGHVRRYSRKAIYELLERCGFKIRFWHYWNSLGLLPYFLIERVAKTQIPERLRYGRKNSAFRRIMWWWYFTVENRLPFPVGLTHFIVAQKPE